MHQERGVFQLLNPLKHILVSASFSLSWRISYQINYERRCRYRCQNYHLFRSLKDVICLGWEYITLYLFEFPAAFNEVVKMFLVTRFFILN